MCQHFMDVTYILFFVLKIVELKYRLVHHTTKAKVEHGCLCSIHGNDKAHHQVQF
jgi:hypothetical protein